MAEEKAEPVVVINRRKTSIGKAEVNRQIVIVQCHCGVRGWAGALSEIAYR